MNITLTHFNRYQAAGIHLLISLVIFAALLAVIRLVWYPGFLFATADGKDAVALIVGVDLILGPLLTLLVFNPTKKSLRIDLTVIALIQAAALTAGGYTIYHTRPVAVVYHHPEFTTLYANQTIAEELTGLINQQPNKPAILFYDDPTGGFAKQFEPSHFRPFNYSPNYVAPLLLSVGQPTAQHDVLSISLDKITHQPYRLLVNYKTNQVLGLATPLE